MSGFDGFIAGGGGGGGTAPIVTITVLDSPFTPTNANFTVLCDASGGPISVTLPAGATMVGQGFNFKKIDASANIITITPNGAELIDGAANKKLIMQYTTISIQTDGSNWYIL